MDELTDRERLEALKRLVESFSREPVHQIMTEKEVLRITMPFIARARKLLELDTEAWEGEHSD